ncbi:type VI secretion system contractile sheath large subunit [Salinibacter sp. 10B]|uniref:type VI secretion system contractile sheath domain-containing protein n=1 Tax=Salinibacter sp. 10B TaxID=1923971 RepID=UPI0015E421C5|nr:type VI secretion system contractile sheath large subunit [Salinibacter sp. 10B]
MTDDSSSRTAPASDPPSDVQIDSEVVTTPREDPHSSSSSPLPFRLLFVSNLTPQRSPADWSETDRRHHIGPKTVADLQAELGPELQVEVPNRLSDQPDQWTVSLSFPTLEAFSPRQIAQQMPPTARLLSVRSLVQKVKTGELSPTAFRNQLDEIDFSIDWADELYRLLNEEPPPANGNSREVSSPQQQPEDALDRVMSMVDTGDTPEPETTPPADPAPIRDAADSILHRLDSAIAAQVHAVLTVPEFRQLEAAWRGLRFLESHIDLNGNVDLLVLPCRRADLHDALHHQVLQPEHNEANDEPPTSLLMIDHAFGHSHVEVDQLADLAGTGQSLQTPVVASVSADFFGLEHLRGLTQLPSLRPHLQGDEYIKWDQLRSEDASSFLSLALPSVQLRPPHTKSASDSVIAVDENEGVFGSGALAVGVAAAQSYAETGWSTHLTQQTFGCGGSANDASLLSAQFSGSMQSELARAGFVVLDETDDGDLRIAHAPSVHEPTVYDDPSAAAEARAEASLPCRLFLARVAHRLFTLRRTLDLTAPLTDLQARVAAEMNDVLEPDTVRVEHVSDVDLPNQEVLAVRLRPPDRILSANARLAMVLRVPADS